MNVKSAVIVSQIIIAKAQCPLTALRYRPCSAAITRSASTAPEERHGMSERHLAYRNAAALANSVPRELPPTPTRSLRIAKARRTASSAKQGLPGTARRVRVARRNVQTRTLLIVVSSRKTVAAALVPQEARSARQQETLVSWSGTAISASAVRRNVSPKVKCLAAKPSSQRTAAAPAQVKERCAQAAFAPRQVA